MLLTGSQVLGYDNVGRLIAEVDYTELVPSTGSFDVSVLPYSNQADTAAGPMAKDYDYDAAGISIMGIVFSKRLPRNDDPVAFCLLAALFVACFAALIGADQLYRRATSDNVR